MRTHAEFASTEFPAMPGEEEEINPGCFGRRLAEFVAAGLPAHGFKSKGMGPEDWGWRVDLENAAFPLWVGCGNYRDIDNGFLVFIDPSEPSITKWFKKIQTEPTIERLAGALEALLQQSGKVTRFRWWTDEESRE
jgi:hypothetical protein